MRIFLLFHVGYNCRDLPSLEESCDVPVCNPDPVLFVDCFSSSLPASPVFGHVQDIVGEPGCPRVLVPSSLSAQLAFPTLCRLSFVFLFSRSLVYCFPVSHRFVAVGWRGVDCCRAG